MNTVAHTARPGCRTALPYLGALTLLACAWFLTGCQSAVTTNTSPQIPPLAEANQPAAPLPGGIIESNRTLPTLFIVGDSTVHNSGPGLLGWGDVIARFCDPAKIRVDNRARPGRSSRTFQTQGWWDQVLAAARPGDFVLIQMGHNDGGRLDDTNRARGTIKGVGEESREIYNPITHQREVVHTYGWYLRKYIADARARDVVPIILSPVPRCPREPVAAGAVERNDYVGWAADVAKSQSALFIDLNRLVMSHYGGKTPQEIKATWFTPVDYTHSSPAGADLNATAVIEGLRALKNCPLNAFLLDKPQPFVPPATALLPVRTNDAKAPKP